MSVNLLTVHHLEFLSLKGGFTGWSESTLVKMPNCWKSRAMAQMFIGMFVSNENDHYMYKVPSRRKSLPFCHFLSCEYMKLQFFVNSNIVCMYHQIFLTHNAYKPNIHFMGYQ